MFLFFVLIKGLSYLLVPITKLWALKFRESSRITLKQVINTEPFLRAILCYLTFLKKLRPSSSKIFARENLLASIFA